ncbi:hypothetical protein D3C79_1052370 [compost metagenome]
MAVRKGEFGLANQRGWGLCCRRAPLFRVCSQLQIGLGHCTQRAVNRAEQFLWHALPMQSIWGGRAEDVEFGKFP